MYNVLDIGSLSDIFVIFCGKIWKWTDSALITLKWETIFYSSALHNGDVLVSDSQTYTAAEGYTRTDSPTPANSKKRVVRDELRTLTNVLGRLMNILDKKPLLYEVLHHILLDKHVLIVSDQDMYTCVDKSIELQAINF